MEQQSGSKIRCLTADEIRTYLAVLSSLLIACVEGGASVSFLAPAACGKGVGAELMRHAEQYARSAGKTLLVSGTASTTAEALYLRQGWTRVGVIPGYALLPDGSPCSTTIFWKALTASESAPR